MPRLLRVPLTQACTLVVTSIVALPVASGATYCGLPRYSSLWTPASPPKLFHVSVASDQLTVDSLMLPAGATVLFETSRVRVADVIVEDAGIWPVPVPTMLSNRIRPNSALGAGFSRSTRQLSSAPSAVAGFACER